MKKILIAIVALVLAGCAVGLVLSYQALGNAESELDAAQADAANLQQELQDTRDSLIEIQHDLQDTANELESTQNNLDEQKNETAEYIDLYESTQEELEDVEEELDNVEEELNTTSGLLDSIQQENEDLQETIDEIQEKLDLYEDTLGTQVFSGKNPPYTSGNVSELVLMNNSNAKDPTWLELRTFLLEDKTDKHLYIPGEYECGNFAVELHNNAEAAGIRAAFVGIHFTNELPHAINAFKTIDLGLVYIDVTGSTSPTSLSNLDRKATLAKDKVYVVTLIFPEWGWGLTQGNSIVQSIEIYW
jgi:archaellum component FlaC